MFVCMKALYRGGFAHIGVASYTHTYTCFSFSYRYGGCFTKSLYRGGFMQSLGALHIQIGLYKVPMDFAHIFFYRYGDVLHMPLYTHTDIHMHISGFFPTEMNDGWWGQCSSTINIFCQELHAMCRCAQKNHVSNNPSPGVGWREWGKIPKINFARNCLKCADMHRKIIYLVNHLLPIVVGSGTKKKTSSC